MDMVSVYFRVGTGVRIRVKGRYVFSIMITIRDWLLFCFG